MNSWSHIIFLLFSHKKLNQASHRESQYREASAGHFHVLSFYRLFFGTQNILWPKNLVTVPSTVCSSIEILVPPKPGKFQVLEIIQSKQAKSSHLRFVPKATKMSKKVVRHQKGTDSRSSGFWHDWTNSWAHLRFSVGEYTPDKLNIAKQKYNLLKVKVFLNLCQHVKTKNIT